MSSARAAMASGFRQSKGDSAFNSQYLHILPVEIITKGLIPKIDSDQELQIVNVILWGLIVLVVALSSILYVLAKHLKNRRVRIGQKLDVS